MNELATELMKDVLDAYAQRDVERAQAVWTRDAELDALEDSVFRDLLTHMMEDPRNISFCAHLLFCSKNIERIGDHATNIAETVFYLVTGGTLPAERPKGRPDWAPRQLGRRRTMNEERRDLARAATIDVAAHSRRRGRDPISPCCSPTISRRRAMSPNASSAATRRNCGSPRARPISLILDWMLPGVSGLEICRRLRARGDQPDLPVIMLTARGEEGERVRGLVGRRRRLRRQAVFGARTDGAGASAAAAQPARAHRRKAVGRRSRSRSRDPAGAARRARRPSRPDRVPPARISAGKARPGVFARAIARRRLGLSVEIDERTVDVHVGRLRKALSRGRERDPIRTVRGAGYSFDETFGRV